MSQAIVAGSGTTYIYSALGQLIQKYGNGGNTLLMYDEAGHILGEYTATGALIQETIWMGDIPAATLRPNGSTGCTSTVCVFYVQTDHLGTPRKITRPSDNGLMWRWDPDTFGSAAPNTNPTGLGAFTYNLRFPGQYYLSESGLLYNYYRDLDPQTGRYIESDPIGLQGGINTYSYAGSNPIGHMDPTGLLEQCRAGLDAINGNDIGPLHHEFTCWKGADGKEVCRGYGRDQMSSIAKAVLGKVNGRILKDDENKTENSTSCGADDKNKCMGDCVSNEWSKLEKATRKYGLITGASCQSVNRAVLQKCAKQCKTTAPPAPPTEPWVDSTTFFGP